MRTPKRLISGSLPGAPGYWLGYSGLGSLYYREGKFSEAVEQFKTMIDLAPDNSLGYYDLGGAIWAWGAMRTRSRY
jgi:tetratricopeptide (TPR) repeat protein